MIPSCTKEGNVSFVCLECGERTTKLACLKCDDVGMLIVEVEYYRENGFRLGRSSFTVRSTDNFQALLKETGINAPFLHIHIPNVPPFVWIKSKRKLTREFFKTTALVLK